MRKLGMLAIMVCVAMSAFGQVDKSASGYQFTDKKILASTPAKDQNSSGTCWAFSGIGLLESELLRTGKGTYDLSEMWIVRNAYVEKARRFARLHGSVSLSGGGAVGDIPLIIRAHGIVPEEVYSGLNYGLPKHNHGELDAVINAYMTGVVKSEILSTAWEAGLNGILDAYLGSAPEKFTYQGKEYTPQTFAASLGLNLDDYVSVTSFTHHPFYKPFALELPDNWSWDMVYNVPLADLEALIDNALEAGYTINWASDVSEPGFSYSKGFAVIPAAKIEEAVETEQSKWSGFTPEQLKKMRVESTPGPEKAITQENRQKAFDNYQTTDDHGMLIVGTAEDQNGTKYYKIKNSWGRGGKFEGYFYASVPFVLYKTTGIMLHKNAIPKVIAKKLGIQ